MLQLLGEQVASAGVTCSLQHLMEELVGRCLSIASVNELGLASRLIEETCRETIRADRTTLWVLEPRSQVLVADIVTPASLGSDYEDGMSVENGKPMMLQLLCKRNPVTNLKGAAGVLFFDDDPANVDECRRAGFLRSHHTPQGFTRAALEGLSGATTKRQCAVG